MGLTTPSGQPRPACGTPDFWPPEGPCDRTADLYALGKTLYLALTGADLSRFCAFADGTLKVPGDGPRAEPLRQVILRACHDDPSARFPTAAAMRRALASLPPRHGPLRRWRRPLLAAGLGAAGLILAAALIAVLVLWGGKVAGPPDPVRIDALEVTLYRGGRRPDTIGTRPALAARVGEAVRVHVRLSRPAYCYLIAYNPDGREQLCYPEGGTTPPGPVKEFDYPAVAIVFRFHKADVGLQAFILVASRKPLPPYARWKAGAGDSPWKPVQGEGVWGYDGRNFEPLGSDRGQEEAFPGLPKPFEDVCEFLKGRPDTEAIRGLAFPVRQGPAGANP
jgi:hypothetical protein